MIKHSYCLIIFLAVFFFPFATGAQEQNFNIPESVPKPVIELFNTVSKIHIDFSQYEIFKKAADYVPKNGEDVSNITNQITNGFNNLDNIMRNHIGVGLKNILEATGNIFIWILEFVVKIIKLGLSYL